MFELKSALPLARERESVVHAGNINVFELAPGQFVSIVVSAGTAVASLFAFASEDLKEWLSVGNTRILLGTLRLRAGHRLFSNRRRTLLVWAGDAGGVHDLLMPPCAARTGASLSRDGHSLLVEQLGETLADIGADRTRIPDPLNLFLHTRVDTDGRIEILPSSIRPGDNVVLRATTGLRCVVLAWSPAAASSAGGALRIAITNRHAQA